MKKFFRSVSRRIPLFFLAMTMVGGSTVYAIPSKYICPESDSRYMTESEIKSLSLQELNYAKNEIYARRGFLFQSQELRDYFGLFSWYDGRTSWDKFSDNVLNDYEQENIDLLKNAEYAKNPDGYPLDEKGYDIYAVGKGLGGGSGSSSSGSSSSGSNSSGNSSSGSSSSSNSGSSHSSSSSSSSSSGGSGKVSNMKKGKVEKLGKSFKLDLDGDGNKETIKYTYESSGKSGKANFTLSINNETIEGYGYNVYQELYGVCLGSDDIYLIVAMNGANNDPECYFYNWDHNVIYCVGSISAALEDISVDGYGTIHASVKTDVLDKNYMYADWEIGKNGILSMKEAETYEIVRKEYKLKKTITVYHDCDTSSKSRKIEPQNILVEYTNGDGWICIKAVNEERWGWYEVGKLSLEEKMKIFGGLNWAD